MCSAESKRFAKSLQTLHFVNSEMICPAFCLRLQDFCLGSCLSEEAVEMAVTNADLVGVGLRDAVSLAVAVVEPLGVGAGLPLSVAEAVVVNVWLGNKLLQRACYLTLAYEWWRCF